MEVGQSGRLKIGAIVQARMQSTRLPGKILMPLPFPDGKPLLGWIIASLKKSDLINNIVLASSLKKENDPLIDFCNSNAIQLFRGDEEDVLSRFINISNENNFDIVVRLTGDNPFVDFSILDYTIKAHIDSGNDYTCTSGLPLGMNFEVFSTKAIDQIEGDLLSKEDREHVTLYFKRNNNFKKGIIKMFEGEELENLRLTIDYPSDLATASLLMGLLGRDDLPNIEFLKRTNSQYKWIFDINNSNFQKKQFDDTEDEIRAAGLLLQGMELKKAAQILKHTSTL